MAKVEVVHEGHVVQDVVIGITQPTTPAGALPPDIGWVQISTSDDRGSIWDTGSGPPTQDASQPGDMYLDVDTGDIYRWDGSEWVLEGNFAPGTDTPEEILAKIITVDGEGSELDADTLDGHDSTYFATATGLASTQNEVDVLEARVDSTESTNAQQSIDIDAIEADNDAQDIAIAGKANAVHTHPQSDVTNLVADLALKAPLASPTFTGDPRAPTPTAGDADTSIATTAFVSAAITADITTWTEITGKPATFPPTVPIAQSDVTNLVTDLALKAPLASPTFTGDPKAPTPATADNDTSIATTAYVKANLAALPPGGASVTISDTAPASPTAGAMWWESDSGNMFIYYTDANSSQWVPASIGAQGPPGQWTQLTQAAYDALSPPNANTLYVVVG